jgi:hypothetical protein
VTDERKTIALGELFTDEEIKLAAEIIARRERLPGSFVESTAGEIARRITRPALARINTTTRQKNDAMYWAYALEYSITSARR